MLAASFYLWKRADVIHAEEDRLAHLAAVARPLGIFVVGLGLSLFAIAAAGIIFQLFAAPPEEPVSGAFSGYPWVEAVFMSGLFVLVGVGAVLFPFALRALSSHRPLPQVAVVIGVVWAAAGVVFLLFGALNFFTHIGLILNTMQ